MNLLGMFGIKVKTKQNVKITKTDNNSVLDEQQPKIIYQKKVYDNYMGKMKKENSFYIRIDNKFSCDEMNEFIHGLLHVLKRYHPYELKERNNDCMFEMPESATYHPTDDYKFDLNQPEIPQDVFDRAIGSFVIVFDDNFGIMCNLKYYKNRGALLLTMDNMNNIVYSEVLMYLFTRGYDDIS